MFVHHNIAYAVSHERQFCFLIVSNGIRYAIKCFAQFDEKTDRLQAIIAIFLTTLQFWIGFFDVWNVTFGFVRFEIYTETKCGYLWSGDPFPKTPQEKWHST